MKEHPLLDVKEDKYFKLHMGTELKSLEELKDALKTMSDETFLSVTRYLNQSGYQLITERHDATAYLLDPADVK